MPKNTIHTDSQGRLYYTVQKDGIRPRITQRKGETKKAFVERCNELDGTDTRLTKYTFEQAFNEFILFLSLHSGLDDQAQSVSIYNTHVKPVFGYRSVNEVTREEVNEMLNRMFKRNLSEWTMRHARKLVSRVFNYLIEEKKYTITNPATGAKIPQKVEYRDAETDANEDDEEGVIIIPDEDLERFWQGCEKHGNNYTHAFEFALYSGLRRGELIGLRWEDIHDGFINVKRAITRHGLKGTKTKKGFRKVPLTDNNIYALYLQWLHREKLGLKSPYVFPQKCDKPSKANGIYSAFNRAKEQTKVYNICDKKKVMVQDKVRFSIHAFRRTFGTKMAEVLLPQELMAIMGHSNISTTMKYYVGKTNEMMYNTQAKMNTADFTNITKLR